jgi:hypothetical protein
MKYSIVISGRGGDFGCGSITAEQYDFWSDPDNEEYLSDALRQNLDEDLVVPEGAELDGYYDQYDDVGHVFGLYEDSISIEIKDASGKEFFAGSYGEYLTKYKDPEDYFEDWPIAGGDELYAPFTANNPGAFVFWKVLQKGCFIKTTIESEHFDPRKLMIDSWDVEGSTVVTRFTYDEVELEVNYSGMDAYSFEAELSWNEG